METERGIDLRLLKENARKIEASLYFVPKLVVLYSYDYKGLLRASCPQTSSGDPIFYALSHYSDFSEDYEEKKSIVLVNWIRWRNEKMSYDDKVEWGLKNNLSRTTPFTLFSIIKQNPEILNSLCLRDARFIETTGFVDIGKFFPMACYLKIDDVSKEATTDWQYRFKESNDLFVFEY